MLEMLTSHTYNLVCKQALTNGSILKVMTLVDISTYRGAMRVKDVSTMFYDFALANSINLTRARFYIFEDIYGNVIPILEEFIESFEPTTTVPVRLTLYDETPESIEKLLYVLRSLDKRFVMEID